MDLVELIINDFLGYEHEQVPLGTGLILLVGANNAGKSSLVAALDVVAERGDQRTWRRIGSTGPACVRARFTLDDGERAMVLGDRVHASWMTTELGREVELTWKSLQPAQMTFVRATMTNSDGVLEEFLTVDAPSLTHVTIRAVPSTFFENPSRGPWELNASSSGGPAEPARHALGTYFPGLAERLAAWQEWYYHFAPVRAGVKAKGKLTNVSYELEPTGFNLGQALLFQQSRETAAWERIRAIVAEILPDAGKLLARVDGDDVEVVFQDPHLGSTMNVKQLGAGVEQALMAIYVGVCQPVRSVVVMEEPEAGLHPAAQRLLLGHIEEWARTSQFLVTTHSPVFLDQRSDSSRTILVRREKGKSTLLPSLARDTEPLTDLGVRLADVASAERILLVEGPNDAAIVRLWFPTEAASGQVAIIGTGGGDRAWQTDLIAQVVEEADDLARRFLFVRDRDELTPDDIAKLERSANIHVLSRREIENYLLDPQALHEVLAEVADGEVPSTVEIESKLPTIADSLRPTVLIKMTAARLAPIRLFEKQEIRNLVESEADLDVLISHVATRVGDPKALKERVRSAWAESEQVLESEWSTRKLELAPGEEILQRLWESAGVQFSKRGHGQMIASALDSVPAEFASVMTRLLSGMTP